MGEILNIIESISEGFPSYSCYLDYDLRDLKQKRSFASWIGTKETYSK